MTKLKPIMAGILISAALCGPALGQGANPISGRVVTGDWSLTITPAERDDLAISVQSADGGPTDFPLTITARPDGRLNCVVKDRPARCRIERGRLIVASPSPSGGATMTFTLTDRTRGGFTGAARLSVRFLPIGGHIGAVAMTRR